MAKLLKFISQNFLFWGICFLLLFVPLYPKFPLFNIPETYVAIRLEDIFVAFFVAVFGSSILYRLIFKKDQAFFKNKVNRLIFLYFGIGLLSVLSGIFITKNISPRLAFFHWLRRVEYMSLLFVAYYSLKDLKKWKYLGWIIYISTVGVIIYGLGQKYFGWPVISTMNKEFSKGIILYLNMWARINSTFAGHYDLAAYMVIVLCLMVAILIAAKNRLVKILILLLGISSYYILILTASRVSFGAYLLGVLFVLIINNKKLWAVPFLVLSLTGMILSGDLSSRYFATFKIDLGFLSGLVKIQFPKRAVPTPTPTLVILPTVTPTPILVKPKTVPGVPTPLPLPIPTEPVYYESTELAVGRSTDIRLKVEWPRAITAFLKNPFLGTGYSSITLATDNDYLRMLGETGILGFFAFFAIILEITRKFFLFLKSFKKNLKDAERIIITGIMGAGVGYFLNATFIDVFEASKIAFFFWILMGLGLRIIDLREQNNRVSVKENRKRRTEAY